jgi:hypothetical protein
MALNAQPTDGGTEQGWALARVIRIHDGMRNDIVLLRRAFAAISADGGDANAPRQRRRTARRREG